MIVRMMSLMKIGNTLNWCNYENKNDVDSDFDACSPQQHLCLVGNRIPQGSRRCTAVFPHRSCRTSIWKKTGFTHSVFIGSIFLEKNICLTSANQDWQKKELFQSASEGGKKSRRLWTNVNSSSWVKLLNHSCQITKDMCSICYLFELLVYWF